MLTVGEKFICCNLEQKINSPVVVDCSVLFLFCVLPPSAFSSSVSSLVVHATLVVVFFSCFRRVENSQGAEARDEEGSGLGVEYCSFGGDIMSD